MIFHHKDKVYLYDDASRPRWDFDKEVLVDNVKMIPKNFQGDLRYYITNNDVLRSYYSGNTMSANGVHTLLSLGRRRFATATLNSITIYKEREWGYEKDWELDVRDIGMCTDIDCIGFRSLDIDKYELDKNAGIAKFHAVIDGKLFVIDGRTIEYDEILNRSVRSVKEDLVALQDGILDVYYKNFFVINGHVEKVERINKDIVIYTRSLIFLSNGVLYYVNYEDKDGVHIVPLVDGVEDFYVGNYIVIIVRNGKFDYAVLKEMYELTTEQKEAV